jgi:hypothetical protein
MERGLDKRHYNLKYYNYLMKNLKEKEVLISKSIPCGQRGYRHLNLTKLEETRSQVHGGQSDFAGEGVNDFPSSHMGIVEIKRYPVLCPLGAYICRNDYEMERKLKWR